MNDTPDDVQALYRALLMRRSGAERLVMGCSMFDTSRELATSRLRTRCRTETEFRVRLFERTYGDDFDTERRRQITAWLSVLPT